MARLGRRSRFLGWCPSHLAEGSGGLDGQDPIDETLTLVGGLGALGPELGAQVGVLRL